MKRITSWIIVLICILLLSIALFVTGKRHKVFLLNGSKGKEVPERVYYIVDGENKEKPKSVKANKKGIAFVKGRSHIIVISFEDLDGNKKEIERKFTIPVSSDAEIDFYGIINNTNDWIKYKEK